MFLANLCFASEISEDYIDIAANYCFEGNYAECESYIDKVLQSEPDNKKALYIKKVIARLENKSANSYISSRSNAVKNSVKFKKNGKKYDEYMSLKNASDENSPDVWAVYYLAEYYRKNNNYTNALAQYRKTLSIKHDFTQCYLQMAVIENENGAYPAALADVNKYLAEFPKSDTAYALRAKINFNLKNYSASIADINKALELKDDITYRLIEAKITYATGKYEDAKKKFEILSKDIKTSDIYKYLGLCDYNLGNYSSAMLNFDKAIILSDDDKIVNSRYNELRKMLENKS